MSAREDMDALAGKRLVILGAARQGTALARFAAAAGASVVLSDLRPAEQLTTALESLADLPAGRLTLVLGEHPLSMLDDADVLAISGGVAANSPIVLEARARNIAITNDSLEFMRRVPCPVIGITGSAGKTTTTALTGLMCQKSGRRTWIGGNIGRPLLLDLPQMGADDLVVQELSSFQLEIWDDISAPIAAILNLTPNHLDRHKTMTDYARAKSNVLRHQGEDGIAVLSADDPGALQFQDAVNGRLRLFSRGQEIPDGAYVQAGRICVRDAAGRLRHLCPTSDIRLRGAHNILNVLAAVTLADAVGVDDGAMVEAIRAFAGVPHRLEIVRVVNGAQYVNDSIATAPERALAAMDAFDEPIILLAGGRDKEMVWDEWARRVGGRAKTIVLFGELAGPLSAKLAGRQNVIRVDTLAEAVTAASRQASPGDVVLLSPGGTSFDAFTDFAERGEAFRELVNAL